MPPKAEHLETDHILQVSAQGRQVSCIVRCNVSRQAVTLRNVTTVGGLCMLLCLQDMQIRNLRLVAHLTMQLIVIFR